MLDAIRSARRFVHLEVYTFRGDHVGHRFRDRLIDRARAGVDVRVVIDALGSHELDPSFFEPLLESGGRVQVFNPLRRLHPVWAPRRRDHRKLLVVDGAVAFTGGLNVGDEYDAPPTPSDTSEGWRDTALRVRGPLVRDLGAVFLESWFRAGGEDLAWPSFLDEPDDDGTVRGASLPDGPVYRRRATRDLLVDALDAATRSARLTSPYFIPDARVLRALEAAASRGVEVSVLVAGASDHPIIRRATRAMAPRLNESGVTILEYRPAMLHAKSAVFDGRLVVVGTSNLDRQSLHHNYEINVVLDDARVGAVFDALFERDCRLATILDDPSLSALPRWTRLVDRLALAVIDAVV